jgi:nitrite reductase/ring-hydroxylating ferredoxin subunit
MTEDDFVLATDEANLQENHMRLVNLAGRSILLTRHGGHVYGLSNRCPHLGCSLSNGTLREFVITCPCHGWSFDIRSGEYLNNKAVTLMTYECKIEKGKIFVRLIDI